MTKPTYSELERTIEAGRLEDGRMQRKIFELEAENLRVRGLLQRLPELPRYEHTCEYGIHCIEKKPLGSYLLRSDVLELVSQGAESADIGKLDTADQSCANAKCGHGSYQHCPPDGRYPGCNAKGCLCARFTGNEYWQKVEDDYESKS